MPGRVHSKPPSWNPFLFLTQTFYLYRSLLILLAILLIFFGFRNGTAGSGTDRYSRNRVVPTVLMKTFPPLARQTLFSGLDSRRNPLAAIDSKLRTRQEPADVPQQPIPAKLEEHTYLPNGLMLVNPQGRHPLYDLIERAEKAWAAKLERQSKTLEEAVQEYHKRYLRHPPRGFDKWWAYVKKHNVRMPDEYDQIMKDLAPFFAYSPRSLRVLHSKIREQPGTYTVSSSPKRGRISLAGGNLGPDAGLAMERARAQIELLRGYDDRDDDHDGGVEAELVEATGEWEATFSAHDGPQDFFDWDLYQEMMDRVEEDMDLAEIASSLHRGWGSACPPGSPLRDHHPSPPSLPLPDPQPKSFIHEHRAAMSPCIHPELVHTVGFLSGQGEKGPFPQDHRKLIFALCKTEGLHGDILNVPVEHWRDDEEEIPWANKTDERMIWRGSTTGIDHGPDTPWRLSQRIRLIDKLNTNVGNHSVLPPSPRTQTVGAPGDVRAAFLNPVLANVGFVGGPIQCHDGACAEMWKMFDWRENILLEDQFKYKYMMDIDGNGWSARFKRLISSNSLVLKVTVFPEWYMDRIQPWVHYAPIKVDLTDLYDVLTFFRGDVSRGGEGGNDALAEKIAAQGREWSKTYWRKEDMIAYTYRLFLEYGRLVSEERDDMNFRLPPQLQQQ